MTVQHENYYIIVRRRTVCAPGRMGKRKVMYLNVYKNMGEANTTPTNVVHSAVRRKLFLLISYYGKERTACESERMGRRKVVHLTLSKNVGQLNIVAQRRELLL